VSRQSELVLDHSVVECGGAVTGTASWSGNTRRERVGVVLRYETQGRGDTDTEVVARCVLGGDEAGRARFRLDVPSQGPITYNGQLLQLLWQVIVCIPVTWATGGQGLAVADLTVAPRGWLRLPSPPRQPSPPRPDNG
jgi:hypothetical protein